MCDVGGLLALVPAHLVGREDRPVERYDDQRREATAAEPVQARAPAADVVRALVDEARAVLHSLDAEVSVRNPA